MFCIRPISCQPQCSRKSTSFNLWSAEILQKLQSWERRSWSSDSNLKHCSAVKKWWFMKCGGCKLNPDTGWQASEGKAKQRWEKFQVVPELQSHWFCGMSDIYFGKGNLQTRDADFGTWRSKSSCVEYTWVLSASISAYRCIFVYLYIIDISRLRISLWLDSEVKDPLKGPRRIRVSASGCVVLDAGAIPETQEPPASRTQPQAQEIFRYIVKFWLFFFAAVFCSLSESQGHLLLCVSFTKVSSAFWLLYPKSWSLIIWHPARVADYRNATERQSACASFNSFWKLSWGRNLCFWDFHPNLGWNAAFPFIQYRNCE